MNKLFQQSSPLQNNAYAFAWALFILAACGAPSSAFEQLQLKDILGYDKPIHAFLFGTQSYLLIRVLRNKKPYRAMVTYACATGVLYGVFIEFLQKYYFEGRAYDYFDMLANTFGCMLVWLWFWRKGASQNQRS